MGTVNKDYFLNLMHARRMSMRALASRIGRLAFCKIQGGPHVIGALRRGYSPGTYNLTGMTARQNIVLESASPVLVVRP